MSFREWSKSEVEYGREILASALEGVRSGRENFLNGRSLTPFLGKSVQKALKPAIVGACLGALGSFPGRDHRSIGKTLAFGLLGGVIGLGTGLIWETRNLTKSAASEALRNIHSLRDKHWLEKNPIDYA